MKGLLKTISEKAIELQDFSYSEEQIQHKWLGTKPVTENELESIEKRLGIQLPEDYINFLKITNGFSAPNLVEPTFEPFWKIDFLKEVDNFIIEVWKKNGLTEIGKNLESSIIVGGIEEEQYFLLIPPEKANDNWKYWKFSSWQPGEDEYENLQDYFEKVLEFTLDELEHK
ncbi:SMI1/KNR4 family protein [Allomuricauda sp. d1]|uniref:SMI1/KNR4 family protein n=1 Tax=Allomuricauda sp. d1 TaxID=3136725 RepID=UPI0031DEBE77